MDVPVFIHLSQLCSGEDFFAVNGKKKKMNQRPWEFDGVQDSAVWNSIDWAGMLEENKSGLVFDEVTITSSLS